MKRVFLFLSLSLLASSQAMACRCINPGPTKAYISADAVVLVKIKAVEVQGNVARMETEVLQSWKLKVTGDTNILTVFSSNVVCPYVGQEGETHLLYLNRPNELSGEGFLGRSLGGFWTGNCKGNLPKTYPQATKHIRWLNSNGRKT